MTEKNNGGPAFPTEVWDSEGVPQHTQGMTLRDYFAAKAMQAMLQSGRFGPQVSDALYEGDGKTRVMDKALCLAEGAYEMADAMLSMRTKHE